jgi:hypothetical protein
MLPLFRHRIDIPNQSRPVRHDRYHRSDIHGRVSERVERVWLDRQRRGLDVVFRRVSEFRSFRGEVPPPSADDFWMNAEGGWSAGTHRSAVLTLIVFIHINETKRNETKQQQKPGR